MFSKALIEKIKAPFPEDAIQAKKGFKNEETGEYEYLTGYKPQYVFERANECFGHDGWDYEVMNHGIEGKDAWVWGRLTLYEVVPETKDRKKLSSVDQFGTGAYNKGTSLGDALKSAATNALEKCLSLKDVGHEAYKGLVPLPKNHPDAKKVNKTPQQKEWENAKKELATICKEAEINKKSFPTLVKTVLKEEKTIEELTIEEIKDLTAHVKKNGTPF